MNWTPSLIIRAILSLAVIIGYYIIAFRFMAGQVKYSEGVREPTIMLLSTMGIGLGAMLQYWFGTSQSSSEKTAADYAKVTPPNAKVIEQTTSQTTTTSTTTPPVVPAPSKGTPP